MNGFPPAHGPNPVGELRDLGIGVTRARQLSNEDPGVNLRERRQAERRKSWLAAELVDQLPEERRASQLLLARATDHEGRQGVKTSREKTPEARAHLIGPV
jgi:hypothetical protein